MSVRLSGSTSGYTELDAGAVASNNTIKLPTTNGTAYQVLRNGATAGTIEFADKIVSMTVNAGGTSPFPASGGPTAVDFTGIPAWVKRVTVMFAGVSASAGGSSYLIQLGAGSVDNAGYISSSGVILNVPSYGAVTQTAGFNITGTGPDSSGLYGGSAIITLLGANTWTLQSCLGSALNARTFFSAGSKTLSGTLDRVRITTVNGTDTFDAGTINILYE
jgi:hypothetical protein